MQPVTIIGAALCLSAIWLRYKIEARKAATDAPPRTRTRKQQLKTAKLLFGVLIAFMGINYALQRLNHNLSGSDPDPSLLERIVVFLDK